MIFKVRLLYNHSSSQEENERRFVVVYLVGFSGELAATELTLDLTLGAVVLQVVGQVAARQLDGAAVGTRDHVEGAGGEVALEGKHDVLEASSIRKFWRLEARGIISHLQLLHLARPATALLAVDAANGQR